MRLTPLRLAFLFGAALFLLGPTTALTQPGGRGGKRGGDPNGGGFPSGKGGGANSDPSDFAKRIFDKMSGGNEVIVIANVPTTPSRSDPNPQATLKTWADSHGITNGQITRDQYTDYMTERMAAFQGGGKGGKGSKGSKGTGSDQPRDYDKDAEASFRKHDKEGNGQLTVDDMPLALRDEWQKWDKNGDGAIDLAEYKEYYKARQAFLRPADDNTDENDPRARNNRNGLPLDPVQEEEKRPTVYRVGHLPKELPPWFEQLDTDKDGQVGLYEWKKGGRDIAEFTDIDKNGDGFLTVEEVLRWQKVELAKKKDPTIVALSTEVDADGNPIELPKSLPAPGSFPGRGSRGASGFNPRGNGADASGGAWAPRGGNGGADGGGKPSRGGGGRPSRGGGR